MKAIVFDICAKVILIPDETHTYGKTGVHRLISDTLERPSLDLCEECADKLMQAVRDVKA